jgi:hypothetical protein
MGHGNKQKVLEKYADCQGCHKGDYQTELDFSFQLLLSFDTFHGRQTENG